MRRLSEEDLSSMPSSMVFRLVREEKSKREKGTPSQNSRLDASSIGT